MGSDLIKCPCCAARASAHQDLLDELETLRNLRDRLRSALRAYPDNMTVRVPFDVLGALSAAEDKEARRPRRLGHD